MHTHALQPSASSSLLNARATNVCVCVCVWSSWRRGTLDVFALFNWKQMESLRSLTGTVSSNIHELWKRVHRETSPQCRTPAERSPFLFDSLQANVFDIDSMENHLTQVAVRRRFSIAILFFLFPPERLKAGESFSASTWLVFSFWYKSHDFWKGTVVHNSLSLLSIVDKSVKFWQQLHRPYLRLLAFLFFLLLFLSLIHLFTRSFIHLFIFFAPCQWSIDWEDSTHLHQRQQQDQPAIIVITVCAYIGLLCFVPHLPSSAGSLSSNLPVITNSRRGNRRKKLRGRKKRECG